MSINFKRWKSLVNKINTGNNSGGTSTQPEVGFKILYCEEKKQLVVKVIGARHLPTLYGTTRPQGYLIKIRVSPGREKYETQIVKEADPIFNQEFNFDLQDNLKRIDDVFSGRFVMFTVYALLENEEEKGKLKRKESFSKQLKNFIGGNDQEDFIREKRSSYKNSDRNSDIDRNSGRNSSSRSSDRNSDSENRFSFSRLSGKGTRFSRNRMSLNNRRTVGAVTYNLESKMFTQRVRHNCIGTLDVWREIQNISSGILTEARESNKGSVEITMCYSNSEDGNNEMAEINLSRLRCSMQTMQEHERYGGSLYLKMTAYEYDVLIATWKSDRFEPTISMKIEPKTATLQAVFRNYNVGNIRVVIRILCKNMLAKKILLGKYEVDGNSDIWKQIIASPNTPVTQMVNFV